MKSKDYKTSYFDSEKPFNRKSFKKPQFLIFCANSTLFPPSIAGVSELEANCSWCSAFCFRLSPVFTGLCLCLNLGVLHLITTSFTSSGTRRYSTGLTLTVSKKQGEDCLRSCNRRMKKMTEKVLPCQTSMVLNTE